MNDDLRLREVEDALREALRVEPSPALLGRVRTLAASARPAPRVAWLAVVAATLVVGSAALSSLHFAGAPAPAPAPTVSGGPPASEPAAPVGPPPAAGPVQATTRRPKPPRPVVAPSAEVIVVPGQAEALARLVELSWSGEVTPPRALIDPQAHAASLAEPAPVRVDPLAIAPLEPSASPDLSPLARGDS